MAMNFEDLLTTLPMSAMADSRLFRCYEEPSLWESVSYEQGE